MSETNANTTPLHTMKPLSVFSDRGVDYVKYRPSYPVAAINTILEGLGDPSQLTAADVGAGTGIASRLLAERGIRVIAIEPNASMRQAADPHPFVEFSDANAEQTNLPEASFDLLTCFQAFHWFNPTPSLSEFRRLLKPSGRLALVWNDWAPDDKFFADFGRLVRKAASKHCPAGKHRGAVNPLLSSPHFVHVRRHMFTLRHELDLFGLIGYAQSKSFVPREGPAQQQLVSDLKELHARWADERGFVCLVYRTNVYLAEPQLHDLGRFRTPLQSWFFTGWRR
jgi:SAM-dependent methyltransferase